MTTALRIDRIDRNFLINGGMEFFQRANNATVPMNLSTTPAYYLDRFMTYYSGTVTGTPTVNQLQQSPDVKTKYAMSVALQRNASAPIIGLVQRIEGIEARDLAAAGVGSFHVWINSPIAGAQVQIVLNVPTAEDNYATISQISSQINSQVTAANTWQQFQFPNLSLPTSVANGLEIKILLLLPSGTDASPQTHLFTRACLNVGPSVSSFARAGLSYAREGRLCNRYYYRWYNDGLSGQLAAGVFDNDSIETTLHFPVAMRATPTVSWSSGLFVLFHPQLSTNWQITSVNNTNRFRIGGVFFVATGTFGTAHFGEGGTIIIQGGGWLEVNAEL